MEEEEWKGGGSGEGRREWRGEGGEEGVRREGGSGKEVVRKGGSEEIEASYLAYATCKHK